MVELVNIMTPWAVALALAFIVEASVEFFAGTPMDKSERLKPHKWLLMYLSLASGIFLAFHYQLDVIALIGGKQPDNVGMFLTGTAVGRGSNFVHMLFNQ